jgi:hypothetical protein
MGQISDIAVLLFLLNILMTDEVAGLHTPEMDSDYIKFKIRI